MVFGLAGAPNLSLKDLLAETMTQATPSNGVSLEESQQRQLSWYHAQLAIKLGAPLEQVRSGINLLEHRLQVSHNAQQPMFILLGSASS